VAEVAGAFGDPSDNVEDSGREGETEAEESPTAGVTSVVRGIEGMGSDGTPPNPPIERRGESSERIGDGGEHGWSGKWGGGQQWQRDARCWYGGRGRPGRWRHRCRGGSGRHHEVWYQVVTASGLAAKGVRW